MSQDTPTLDYLAPDISELAQQRGGGGGFDPLDKSKGAQNQMTRAVARRLLPACVVAPALLWWVLFFGVHRGLYKMETCFVLFVYSVTVVFGVIVCLNLRRLSRMDVERTQAQEQLKRARDTAEAANRFKSMFFANISHEIRTPLTAINGFAELLLNPERTDEEKLGDARVIRRNGEHLLTLINDILDLSKIEAGKMSVERILCCPAGVVGEVCSMLRQRAAEKGLTLDVNFDGTIPKLIRTDPTRLRQVLINLIANAIKFTKEGGVRLTVSVKPSVRHVNPRLEIKIADTGIGIPLDQQADLFQPFVQGDASISRQYGGSGLGLAISRHFAKALGGDIGVTSEPGRGSTFTVAVATGSLADAAIHEHPEEAMDAQINYTSARVRITGSVLVAEDGIDNQALIAAKLRETGLKIEIASNGQLALEKALEAAARGTPFDLILMDVQMPVMDGFTATLQLRSKGYRGPIVALTANAMDRDRSKCLSAGCNDFVTKPIQMEKLLKAMGRYLTIVPVVPKSALKAETAAVTASRAAQVRKFYEDLPGELEQIEQAIVRQDRVRVKEIAQLMLGKAAAAGLKEVAPQAAKLMQSAESEPSWMVLRQAVIDFARDTAEPEQKLQAA
jgi:signal transduction histidine kinase/CheY-like chemotaxis protein/HPt (histidine-containing phosphotransfer) domain-containing protein